MILLLILKLISAESVITNNTDSHADISDGPNSRVTAVDRESTAAFTCEARWIRSRRFDRFCDFTELSLQSEEAVTTQLALSLEWEIDQMGPFNSTQSLTPALTQRGINISTTCVLDAEQLFDILVRDERDCEDRITDDLVPHCTSYLIISTLEINSNTQFQCSVRPLQCTDDFVDRSSIETLSLQGRKDHAYYTRYRVGSLHFE